MCYKFFFFCFFGMYQSSEFVYYLMYYTADVLSGNQPDGEVHLGILQQWFGIHWWNSREFALLITLIFILLPLVLYRRVGKCQ